MHGLRVRVPTGVVGLRLFDLMQVIGYLGFVVAKWQKWLKLCHAIDGKSTKLAQLIGYHVIDGSDDDTRYALFHIWRYLSLANFLCYKSMTEQVSACPIRQGSRTRKACEAWLSHHGCFAALASGLVPPCCSPVLLATPPGRIVHGVGVGATSKLRVKSGIHIH